MSNVNIFKTTPKEVLFIENQTENNYLLEYSVNEIEGF